MSTWTRAPELDDRYQDVNSWAWRNYETYEITYTEVGYHPSGAPVLIPVSEIWR